MAFARASRSRARKRYVQDGWSFHRIAAEEQVGKTTLQRWAKAEGWEEQRREQDQMLRASRKLLVEMMGAAMESKDPQQVYAATQIAELAGVQLGPQSPSSGPSPRQCAVILLDVLGKHHAIGPVVRSHRNEVIRLFLQEVDRVGEKTPAAAG